MCCEARVRRAWERESELCCGRRGIFLSLYYNCLCWCCCCCYYFAFHLLLCMCFKMNAHIFLCAPVQLFICCVILLFIYLFLLFLCMGMSVCAFFCAILLLSAHTPFCLLSLSFSHLTHTLLLALDFSASRFDLSLDWFMGFFFLLFFISVLLLQWVFVVYLNIYPFAIFLWLHHHLSFSCLFFLFTCTTFHTFTAKKLIFFFSFPLHTATLYFFFALSSLISFQYISLCLRVFASEKKHNGVRH